MNVGAIVLAAGEGRRLGLGPKAHVDLGGATFLERVVRTCRDAGIDRVWVVGRPTDTRIEPACEALSVALVVNPEPERGMSSSVHVGLRAAQDAGMLGVVVFPVDHPLVRTDTVANLMAAVREDAYARPVHGGRHGHPVVLGAAVITGLLAHDLRPSLRDALGALGARRIDLAVEDAGTVDGVDLAADLARVR